MSKLDIGSHSNLICQEVASCIILIRIVKRIMKPLPSIIRLIRWFLDYPEFPREKFKVESHLSTAKFVDFLTMCVSEMFITRYTRTEEIISLIFAYHCHYHIALSLCWQQVKSLTLNNVHLIGHSLGSHIAGYVGKNLTGSIGRITGLDPAEPYFQGIERLVIKLNYILTITVVHSILLSVETYRQAWFQLLQSSKTILQINQLNKGKTMLCFENKIHFII